jgi:double-stranded uracil-DNA glycosylase
LSKDVLKDILKKNLDVIFVGSAASDISASKGHYYANPRNSFWKMLYEAGLTNTQLLPKDDCMLVNSGFGLTDVIKSQHGTDSKLSKESLEEDRKLLKAKIKKFSPRVVCFTSKYSYRAFFGNEPKSYGLQPTESNLSSHIFVVPSSSPQVMPNRRLNGKTRLEWFKELAKLLIKY